MSSLSNSKVQLIIKIISILIGVFLLSGTVVYIGYPVASMCLFLGSILCFPAIHHQINKFVKKNISGFIYIPIVFILIIITSINTPKIEQKTKIQNNFTYSSVKSERSNMSSQSINSSISSENLAQQEQKTLEEKNKLELEQKKKDELVKKEVEIQGKENQLKLTKSKTDFDIIKEITNDYEGETLIWKNDNTLTDAKDGDGNYRVVVNLNIGKDKCDNSKNITYSILKNIYISEKLNGKVSSVRINIPFNLSIIIGKNQGELLTKNNLWTGKTNFWKVIEETSLVKYIDDKSPSEDKIQAQYNSLSNCKN